MDLATCQVYFPRGRQNYRRCLAFCRQTIFGCFVVRRSPLVLEGLELREQI